MVSDSDDLWPGEGFDDNRAVDDLEIPGDEDLLDDEDDDDDDWSADADTREVELDDDDEFAEPEE